MPWSGPAQRYAEEDGSAAVEETLEGSTGDTLGNVRLSYTQWARGGSEELKRDTTRYATPETEPKGLATGAPPTLLPFVVAETEGPGSTRLPGTARSIPPHTNDPDDSSLADSPTDSLTDTPARTPPP